VKKGNEMGSMPGSLEISYPIVQCINEEFSLIE
jgi:hypothetical protein